MIQGLLIPVASWSPERGRYRWPRQPVLAGIHVGDREPLAALAATLRAAGLEPSVQPESPRADFVVRRDRSITHPETYRLTITRDGIELVSGQDAGAFYGLHTLAALVRTGDGRLPLGRIEDAPAFSRRVLYLDCARGRVPSPRRLKALVEQLAAWKVNELQLYIENAFTFERHPAIGRGWSPLRPSDILDVQAHARRHHVRLVGSLASFGHMEKTLSLPEYTHLGELPGYRGLPGGTTLCPGDPGSQRLMRELYEEYLPLFEAEDFNICGDEPWELGEGRSAERVRRAGKGRVYLDFIMGLRRTCLRHGKRVNLWGDIVLAHPEVIPDLPRDMVMLNWDYAPEHGRMGRSGEFASAGLPWIACGATHGYRSHGTRYGMAMANLEAWGATAATHGAEGLMVTDWGDNGHRQPHGVSLPAIAFGAAQAWRPNAVDSRGHLRRFTRTVLGDADGRWAEGFRAVSDPAWGCWAYDALTEHLDRPETFDRLGPPCWTSLDDVKLSEGRLDRLLAALDAMPAPPDGEALVADVTEEWAMAARLNRLAAERLRLARAVRGGKRPAGKLKAHAEALDACAADYARIWRLSSRPSRLRDHLEHFRLAAQEARSLAGVAP